MKSVKKEIEYKTKHNFCITEDSLHRLIEIIRAFYLSLSVNEEEINDLISLQAICADNAIITTDDVQDILGLENRGITSIKKLKIYSNLYKGKAGINFKIEFSTYDSPDKIGYISPHIFYSIYVYVEGSNSDNCVRLMHSLKTYIENSIFIKHSNGFSKLFWFLKTTTAGIYLIMILYAILATAIVINIQSNHFSPFRITLIILISIFTLVLLAIGPKTELIATRLPYIFKFGTNPEDYTDRIRFIKIVCGVFGTVFLSIISTLLYDIIFK